MRAISVVAAGFILASAMFVATMLIAPPTSEAAAASDAVDIVSTSLVLVGP